MSNFNANPVRVTAPMTQSFWTTLRGLGLLGTQFGKPIYPISITWVDPGQSASVVITDGISLNQIFTRDTDPTFAGGSPQYVFIPPVQWRDWQVVILSGGELEIAYK